MNGGSNGTVGGGRRSRSSSINKSTIANHQRRVSEASRLSLSMSLRAGGGNINGINDPSSLSLLLIPTSAQSPAAALETATSVADIRTALAALHTREDALTSNLQNLVASQSDLSRDLLRLDSLRASLGAQVIATRGIATSMLAGAADTAGRLSSTVRNLDLEKTRVEATLRVVEQVAELKACVAGVAGSMGAPQDWEAAAAYLARASRIPDAIVNSGFASAVVPTVEVPDPPAVTLEQARESLCGLFLREFERAAKESNDAHVTRFFKLFPLIGRTDVGLDVYGRYVCQGVAQSARNVWKDAGSDPSSTNTSTQRDTRFYVHSLSKLFAHISQIVEGHGAIVERHYGGGQMVKVIKRLQKEADVQGGIIVDAFNDDRGIDRKLTEVKSYPFSFLVQSFLNLQRGPGAAAGAAGLDGSLSRVNSPALGSSGDPSAPDDDEGGVSMPQVNTLISEMASLLSLWAFYTRFLAGKCGEQPAASTGEANGSQQLQQPATPTLVYPSVLAQSNLHKKVSARLTTPFNLMCIFLFRRAVERAFQMEEPPVGLTFNMRKPLDGNPPYILSSVDVIMYMTDNIMKTLMKAHSREAVQAVIPPMGRVLASDFVGMIQRKMRDEAYPRNSAGPGSSGHNSSSNGGGGPITGLNGNFPTEDRVIQFILLVNTLDMATQYLAKVVSDNMGVPVEEDEDPQGMQASGSGAAPLRIPAATAPAVLAHLGEAYPFENDAGHVANTLANFYQSFAANAGDLCNEGAQVLFNQVVKPRLRPLLADTFRDADYALTELDLEEWAEQQQQQQSDVLMDLDELLESVSRRFEQGWSEGLMRPLGRVMTPRSFRQVADLAARHLAKMLEKRVWSQLGRTSAYGAIRMERDLNGIVGAVARGSSSYGVRELFSKTTQILMVANMEEDEWEELGGGAGPLTGAPLDRDDDEEDQEYEDDGMIWLLSEDERRRARGMVKR
ncbi:hypothetical protein F503_03268 [Ophiostoma piceae UAMH 11346]|uniref:Conserved oligomeric Golgi complex subunit 4 n=1 Tax=Ophiostoma piceae (strain UAMH 11346) TaxID=1262450 RepID=S3C4S1_OPHP1|nr:hypothetical protein F503_03268 [Ophiostoma piceae UAMH 11346]